VDFTVYHFQLFSNSNNCEANDGLQLWSDYTDFIYDKYLEDIYWKNNEWNYNKVLTSTKKGLKLTLFLDLEFYLGSCLPAVLSRCIGRQC
jgi:hypothetical protein